MSYPPRGPPMGMGMGYGYPPMGMMPMGMMPPGFNRMPHPPPPQQNRDDNKNKLVPQEIPEDEEEKPPVTTVFVGNISDKAPDAMIRQMLNRCGNVLSWKRVQGASGKLQAFGFCEYERPEATLRCIRLLNDWEIADKKLVVKVDAKTKSQLEEYQERKKLKGDDETITDEFSQREDRVAKAGLDAIMREYSGEINKNKQLAAKQEAEEQRLKRLQAKAAQMGIQDNRPKIRDIGLDDLHLADDEKSLIHREINSFRSLHKDEDDKKDDTQATPKERKREDRDQRTRGMNRNTFIEPSRDDQDRDRRRDDRSKGDRSSARTERNDRNEPSSRRHRSKSLSKSPSRSRRSKSSDRYRDENRENDDAEDLYERRKLERKLREKESAYQERLKNWEARERKRARDYDKEKEKDEDRKTEEGREARRLKEFLEDYDDERDDPKFYRSSALSRRLKEREREIEADNKDRQREKEEIEEIRKKLMEEGHPDPEAELAKMEQEQQKHSKTDEETEDVAPLKEPPSADIEEEEKHIEHVKSEPIVKPVNLVPEVPSSSEEDEEEEETGIIIPEPASADEDSQPATFIGPQGPPLQNDRGRSKTPDEHVDSQQNQKKKKLTVGDVFNNEDDDNDTVVKKRKLVPLDYNEEDKTAASKSSAEDKRKLIKNLIERIPTAKEELFAYQLAWGQVDTVLMDKRIKPWVNKKIIEYIGEEEPTLTEFICQKVMAHSLPQSILNDVAMVLDEEAEVFVVKMWRLLIYETEAKKLGLAK